MGKGVVIAALLMIIQLQESLPSSLVISLKEIRLEALIFSSAKQKTLGKQEIAFPQMPDFLTSIVNNIDHTTSLSTTPNTIVA